MIFSIVFVFMLRFPYCVCYGHVREEFRHLLHVLKKYLMVAHENCDCTCGFCINGQCQTVFESEMDLYWCMRHPLCGPSKLYSQISRNLLTPTICALLSLVPKSPPKFLRIPPVCSCLDGHCTANSPCFFVRTNTNFQCSKSALYSQQEPITFDQCVNCITPDLNKRNKQVTHFIDTVFATYSNYYRTGGHGCIRYFSLRSDTLTGVQLSCKSTD